MTNGDITINSSSNVKNIANIVTGGVTFSFDAKDITPSLRIDFSQPKILLRIALVDSANIKNYDVKVYFQDGKTQKFQVSYRIFKDEENI